MFQPSIPQPGSRWIGQPGPGAATLPWTRPQPLPDRVELGPGLEPELLTAALRRLCDVAGVKAVIAYGSRGRGEAHAGTISTNWPRSPG